MQREIEENSTSYSMRGLVIFHKTSQKNAHNDSHLKKNVRIENHMW